MTFQNVMPFGGWSMSISNFLSSMIRSSQARTYRSPQSGHNRRRSVPLSLEVLEDRSLLSVYTVDGVDDRGQGSGLAGDLRYCITQAQNGDTINFAVSGTIDLTNALPTVTHGISIQGPGASLMTVERAVGQYSVFTIGVGVTVSISGLTISHGVFGHGGGISNSGALTIRNCVIAGNETYQGSSGGGIYDGGGALNTIYDSTIAGNTAGEGGGIWNGSANPVTIYNSTISGNTATGPNNGGGGIFGRVTLVNSTVSGNIATPSGHGGGGISGQGFSGPFATLVNSTITGNSAGQGQGGGILGDVTTRNTIIAGNTAATSPDASGNIGSQGHNLIGNTSGATGFDGTDLLNVNPRLGTLQDNGGPTQTMALSGSSPALNAGDSSQLGTADQRGVIRAGGVNIGAYQASASAFLLIAPVSVTAGTPFNVIAKAVDTFRQTAVGYRGTAHFASSDSQAVLPGNYTFTAGDGGQHTFPNGFTLATAGNQTVTATDTVTASITGNATASVNPAAADHLLFLQQPTDTMAGQTISAVIVEIVDQFGNVLSDDNSDTITISIGNNPGGGMLSGTLTLTVVNGIATFTDLSIDLVGDGYTLHATTTGLTDADSVGFSITA
jgi:hypothetical protein